MKISKLMLCSMVFGGLIGFSSKPSEASSYYPIRHYHTYTPRSWRGTYHTSAGDVLKVKTYSVTQNGKTFYKRGWNGWRKLAFAKVDSSYYTFNALAKYGYQSSRRWRLKYTNEGKKELINSEGMGSYVVWHKYTPKAPKPQNYDLNYKSAPASLKDCVGKTVFSGPLADVDYPTELYPTLKDMDADTENNLVKITDSGVPMGLIKVGSYNGSHYANVSYQGNSYFVLVGDPNFSTEEVEPYNTSYADGVVSSPFKPTDKADILVKNNQWINTKYQWDYTNLNTEETYSYTFNLKKDKWEQY